MDAEEFVQSIVDLVRVPAMEDTLRVLEDPPGRKPAERDVRIAGWLASLGPADKAMVEYVIEESVDTAVFGFLCVLDGVRTFSDDPEEIIFLEIGKEGIRERGLLNDFNDEFLHDRYQRLKT